MSNRLAWFLVALVLIGISWLCNDAQGPKAITWISGFAGGFVVGDVLFGGTLTK